MRIFLRMGKDLKTPKITSSSAIAGGNKPAAKIFSQDSNSKTLTIWSDNTIDIIDSEKNQLTYWKDTDNNGKYDTKTVSQNFKQTKTKLNEKENEIFKVQNQLKKELADEIKNEQKTKSQTPQKLTADSQIDGKIENFKQTTSVKGPGDCWLLAGIQALSETKKGKEQIKKNIYPAKDNGASIHLQGLNKTYSLSFGELDSSKQRLSTGDVDVRAIELAVERHRKEVIKNKNFDITQEKYNSNLANRKTTGTSENPLDGGKGEEAFFLLTGKKSEFYHEEVGLFKKALQALVPQRYSKVYKDNEQYVKHDPKEALAKKQTNPERYAMVTGFRENKGKMVTEHSYSIRKVDKDFVTVINPWDTSKEIKIPKKEFLENYSEIISCDMDRK